MILVIHNFIHMMCSCSLTLSLPFRTARFQTGRPDGGEGGDGGCVIFVADGSVKSLNSLTTNYRGRNGEHGRSAYHSGRGGANVVVKVLHIIN